MPVGRARPDVTTQGGDDGVADEFVRKEHFDSIVLILFRGLVFK